MFVNLDGIMIGSPELTAEDWSNILIVLKAANVPGDQTPAFAEIIAKVKYHQEQAVRRLYAPQKEESNERVQPVVAEEADGQAGSGTPAPDSC